MQLEASRYERGLEKLAEVDGTAGEEVVGPLGDLGRYIVEFALGTSYAGFPTAINALTLMREVVEGRSAEPTEPDAEPERSSRA